MDTNFDSKKLELIQWLASVEDKKIIEKLIDFRNEQNSDWWQNASQSERDSITKGLKDAEDGKLNEHSEAKKIYGKWL
jgi:predicted transcriptional regulator